VTIPRPHDLLRLTDSADVLPAHTPNWVDVALTEVPWVVVRRAVAREGWVAVGVRGRSRAQRYAMTVPSAAVERIVTPEQLSAVEPPARRDLPAVRALRTVRRFLSATGLPWGPTGSVGFELATGAHTITRASDLDVVLRVDSVTPQVLQRLSVLHSELQAAAARVDCQIEMAKGAVTLADIVSSDQRVLVRSTDGPRLETVAELPR
jgi:phosphoribosyl-dephospho-CoA transferase